MTISPGLQFDHYEILGPLSKGGMGEVFRARDTRLNREVALKVLPAEFAQDADRLRRFELEAMATSSLNHPNILTAYDFGNHEGNPFLVMELLEGEELRAQLEAGALAPRKAIEYAQQIAAGLAAAHEKGIVHRDLKPENLFVTKDGRVKILDFGLAKLRPPRNAPTGSDVATQKQYTSPGTVMGTVAYMSPEQVRGQDLEQRSDIFSFGLILYEMLAGQRAFQAASQAETMAAIANAEPPDLTELNTKVTPQLDKIVRHCLEKKPEMRFQSARDLGFALEALMTPGSSGKHRTETVQALETTTKRSGGRERAWMSAAGVLGLIALAMAVAYFKRSANDARAVRLSFTPPENVAFDNGRDDCVIVSPDGQKLVFTGRAADGKRQLYVRSLDASEATPLPATEDPYTPFWSPDSRSIGFVSKGRLKRIDVAGGRPQELCSAPRLYGGTWNRAGVILFAPDVSSGLFRVPATGGEPMPVTTPDPFRAEISHISPHFLPDGRHFLYAVGDRGLIQQRIVVGSLDSKEVKHILGDGTLAGYAPPGWLLFVRSGALLAQSFDAKKLELQGEAVPLTKPNNNNNRVSVSENGVLIWQGDTEREFQLAWFDRAGKQGETIGLPVKSRSGFALRLSPDGKRALTNRVDPQTLNRDIWVIDLARNLFTRLTTDLGNDQTPTWSPNGSQAVFYASRGDVLGLYQKDLNSGAVEELLLKGIYLPLDWSPDGRFIILSQTSPKSRRDIWALPLFGDRQPSPLLNSEFDEYRPQFSPDMRWLVYVSDESGSYEVYVQPFTADGKLGGSKQRISTNGGNQPRFSRNGQELFYIAADGMMMAVKINGTTFESPKPLFKTRMLPSLIQSGIEYDVTADGQRFLIGTQVGEPSPVSVILNWTEGLKK